MGTTSILVSLIAPACTNDSKIDLYESCSSTYFPIKPILIFCFGFLSFLTNSFQSTKSDLLFGIFNLFKTTSSNFSSCISSGTS